MVAGPYHSGKTHLFEALLHATGAIHRKGAVAAGTLVGDHQKEARKRQGSTELSVGMGHFLGDPWVFIDTPGGVEFGQDARDACLVADIVIVVVEAEVDKVSAAAPLLHYLDGHNIPHVVFINKVDHDPAPMRMLMDRLQAISERPMILRQVPLLKGEAVTGYVDLVSARAYRYADAGPSALIEMPAGDPGGAARDELLETLADYDDVILEHLLEDRQPATAEVYQQFTETLRDDLLVPVLLGAGALDRGVQRLLKPLRHDAPAVAVAAARRGFDGPGEVAAEVFKTMHAPHLGKLSLARLWRGSVKDGDHFGSQRLSGLYRPLGGKLDKLPTATAGEVVALGRLEETATGDVVGTTPAGRVPWPAPLPPVFALAITATSREDEVKLSGALQKLVEEDRALVVNHNAEMSELTLEGQGDTYLRVVLERLVDRFHLTVDTAAPQTPYRETITKSIDQHARYKKQSGGHGQFGDVKVTVRPRPRGEGFNFSNTVVGGAVPRNFIPAVGDGVRDYLRRGPLGFQVVDVEVILTDGAHHSVDSSEMAFRAAGRLAMAEGLPKCGPILLEPIDHVVISAPNTATARVQRVITARRGQILGFQAKEGWQGWDEVQAYMPVATLHDLIIEIRALSHGMGFFTREFDHLAELSGREAETAIAERQAAHG